MTDDNVAEWQNAGVFDNGYQINLMCPACNEVVSGCVWDYKFCPYCGKEMRRTASEDWKTQHSDQKQIS